MKDQQTRNRFVELRAQGWSYERIAKELGVSKQTGNVLEWVADWYDGDYYQNAPRRNPKGPDSGTQRGSSRWLLVQLPGGPALVQPLLRRSGVSRRRHRFSLFPV